MKIKYSENRTQRIFQWKKAVRHSAVTFSFLGAATLICFGLQRFEIEGSQVGTHVPLLYVLAVLLISRYTEGYLYGIVASMISVVAVNYAFTYPYFAFNFTITGYPITFIVLLAVALFVSTLTTQIKEKELIRLEAEKEKMRGNLLRAVSHDIRTPLTSILGSASGMIDNYDSLEKSQKIELLEDIREEAQWLIRIVENLLSVTRINGERARISTTEEVVEEIISGAVVKFEKRFPEAEIRIDMPQDMLLVAMDGILIEQVLVNLFENAILHGKTTKNITVRVWEEKNRVYFAVEDDGEGIKENILPILFDGQLQSGQYDEYDTKRNMGIGLSVCMSIVKAHKGMMKAENRKEGGARFYFWIPAESAGEYGNQG
ncbi:MAG: DUF4118 domain-containing protein [Lachnospiraceae bacterium]|nr:DUF4118 domain-containing protein [Lachnospiraceae bacterium]